MTAIAQLSEPIVTANEDLFISHLHDALDCHFNIKTVASPDGQIKSAQVNAYTHHDLENAVLKKLMKVAAEWNLKLLISRSGTAVRIHFLRK